MNILMVTSEAVPLAKTGGLGDMVTGLSNELARRGHDVKIMLPGYASVDGHAVSKEPLRTVDIPVLGKTESATIERLLIRRERAGAVLSPDYVVVGHDGFFNRRGLYQEGNRDYPDNLARFAFFSRAAVEWVRASAESSGWVPDIIHTHDWQAALVPLYLRADGKQRAALTAIRNILTIHNLGYQGIFPASEYAGLGLPPKWFSPAWLEFFGSVNLLKGGIVASDWLTTVSPTYAREIQLPELGFGLDGVLRERRDRLLGITNGIDIDQWDPSCDPWLPSRYSAQDYSGKRLCKAALQQEMQLPVGIHPLIGVVSRLVEQKGIDLVVDALEDMPSIDFQLVVLGTGDPLLERRLRNLEEAHPTRVRVRLGFNEELAHRIQAGADIALVPSRYEPCGLTQLCSLRYGTVPVVRKTGGLADTVVGYPGDHSQAPTGFVFDEPTPDAFARALGQALQVYRGPDWKRLIESGMNVQVGWKEPARQYEELYKRLCAR
ncbi:MAG TPA: glycogen synthase GlgA [Nitrospiraceae bacterium]|nr:glycogen synthase GlgA [Nitrospiraceae bacterium]